MKLNNQQLINFVNRIKLSTKDKAEYKKQIEFLKTQVDIYLDKHPLEVGIKTTKQAGSWAKGTILKPSINTDLDIDIVFYLKAGEIDDKDLHKINETIVKLLKKIYPTKKDEDFTKNPKTANVLFRTSGLSVDIVPVIKITDKYPSCKDLEDYALQPDNKSFEWYITSIDKQLSFISDRKKINSNYTNIVRILKKWKAVQKLSISSFAIELIVAYLDIKKDAVSDISEALLRAWAFLSQKTYPKICFDTLTIGEKSTKDTVQITDPTNTANNVTKYLSKSDWDKVREKADVALDTICLANEKTSEDETLNLWREILGDEFNITQINQNN